MEPTPEYLNYFQEEVARHWKWQFDKIPEDDWIKAESLLNETLLGMSANFRVFILRCLRHLRTLGRENQAVANMLRSSFERHLEAGLGVGKQERLSRL